MSQMQDVFHSEQPQSDLNAVEVQKAMDDAFLGYALLCIATMDDLGEGPTVQTGSFNPRVPNLKSVAEMWAATDKGARVMNMVADHAIDLCLNPSYVKRKSLNKDPNGKLAFIHWTEEAKEEGALECFLANGLHRWYLVMFYLCKRALGVWKSCKKGLEKAEKKKDKGKIEELRAKEIELRDFLRENGKWMMRVYDNSELEV
jgi:hypothetical protein